MKPNVFVNRVEYRFVNDSNHTKLYDKDDIITLNGDTYISCSAERKMSFREIDGNLYKVTYAVDIMVLAKDNNEAEDIIEFDVVDISEEFQYGHVISSEEVTSVDQIPIGNRYVTPYSVGKSKINDELTCEEILEEKQRRLHEKIS